jgi:hypothetical protein
MTSAHLIDRLDRLTVVPSGHAVWRRDRIKACSVAVELFGGDVS